MMDITTSLISIIIPVYQVEPYLRKCLDSVVNQTYKNLEIILVDDGSPDRCGTICDEYAAGDERIVVIHQDNQGVSAARNAGLQIARGDYIQFIDSDDWVERNACETALRVASGQNADLVCFRFKFHLPSGEIRDRGTSFSGRIDKSGMMNLLMSDDDLNAVTCKLFSKDLFNNLRFVKGRYCEDMDILYKIAHRAQGIYLADDVLYHYCRHADSLTSLRYQANSIKSRILIFRERLIFFEQHYPEHADRQAAMLMRELLLGREWLKGDPDYPEFLNEYHGFMKRYHSKIRDMKKFNRLIALYYYCPPLALLYEKGRHLLYHIGIKRVVG